MDAMIKTGTEAIREALRVIRESGNKANVHLSASFKDESGNPAFKLKNQDTNELLATIHFKQGEDVSEYIIEWPVAV